MSHIFDALQRSESERSGTDSPAASQATELLQRVERRAALKWEKETLGEQSAGIKGAKHDTSCSSQKGPADANTEELLAPDELLPFDAGLDVFAKSLPLQVSVAAQSRLICFTDGESPAAEAFRLLGVRLRDLRRTTPLKKLLITSTIPQEGKSMVAANLACTLALSATQKTLLIEGDLRRPSLLQMFGIGSIPGLSEWLQGERCQMPSIYRLEGPGLWILPAGSFQSNALELLQSGALPTLIDQLAARFDWMIIDSPPVLPMADASIWTRLTDGILLVTRQGTTEKRQLQKGLEALDLKKLVGALLNCSENSPHDNYYYRQPKASSLRHNSSN